MALYHTYRPQTFADVVGQEHIVATLQNQIKRNTLAHAYLFSGPRGVGKTTSARLLAKAVNCTNRKAEIPEPCSTCQSCLEITQSRSIDVIEIDAASNTGVDHVREHIIENAQFRPTSSTYKIFIIDEVHMLSISAFNALLKTLEEPPAHTIFILATTELHKLPETIISRCQTYHFKKIPFKTMKAYLQKIVKKEGVSVDGAVIERIIAKSDGCARDAVSLLDQIMATGEKKITSDMVEMILPTADMDTILGLVRHLLKKDAAAGLLLVRGVSDAGVNLFEFASNVIEILRAIMIANAASQLPIGIDINDTSKKEINDLAKSTRAIDIIALIDLFMCRRQEIKSAPTPDLPLEMAVISWCGTASQTAPPPPPAAVQKKSGESLPVSEKTTKKEQNQEKKIDDVSAFSISDVENAWSAIVQKIEQEFPSLVFILNMATVVSVEKGTLTLSVRYSFHRDKLMESTTQKRLAEIFSEALGKKAVIVATVSEEAEDDPKDQELHALTSAFGGKIIT